MNIYTSKELFDLANDIVAKMNDTVSDVKIRQYKKDLKNIGARVFFDSYVGWCLSTRLV